MQNQGHPAWEALPTEVAGEAQVWGGCGMDLAMQAQEGGMAEATATLGARQGQPGLASPGVKPQGHPAWEVPSAVSAAMGPAWGLASSLGH